MSDPRYLVGVDLGTTNTALSYVEISALGGEAPVQVHRQPIQQLVRPGDLRPQATLPSFLYLPEEGELPEGALSLPWDRDRDYMVGEAARARGAEVPLRMVHSAKSWLSHSGVDRSADILPPQTPEGTRKISPVEAARRYLQHLVEAWGAEHPEAPLAEQDILLTVPASFDAVARELTTQAAMQAGLQRLRLLEEPQAAFYAWLSEAGSTWRDQLKPGDRVLVCDLGGGTTDFSLIEVKDDGEGNLSLDRVAVGDHILLGGDNMDLALAHVLHQKLLAAGKKLGPSQQRALVQGARRAKEALLSDPNLPASAFTILGKGSKLIGGKIKVELTRQEVETVLLDGFFPACGLGDKPAAQRRTGFMELGLPYVSDAAVTRHLASFLSTHSEGQLPTHILFNGGVFNSQLLQDRLLSVVEGWGAGSPVVLRSVSNDLAVSLGAAHYGALRMQGGLRIRGGVARSYYIGIESAMPAVPGVPPPMRALCVVPFGMEEGSEAEVPKQTLGLVVGEEVSFRFLTATSRKEDAIGAVLDEYSWPELLTEIAPVHATLQAEGLEPGTLVPVHLQVKLTELGTLELWSVAVEGGQRWRLEYELREERAG